MRKFYVDLEHKELLLESIWDEVDCFEGSITLIPSKNLIIVSKVDEQLAEIRLVKFVDEYDVVKALRDEVSSIL